MILDTSFFIDVMEHKETAVRKLHELIDNNEPQIITTPTIFELWSGISRSKQPVEEKKKILFVLAHQTIYSLDQASAEVAGEIDGTLAQQGQTIDPEDCMIAGIAKLNNQPILTNDKHFERIKDIIIERY